MSDLVETTTVDTLPDPITRSVDIKDEDTNTWSRHQFVDLVRGMVFRVIGDPTIDGTLEWVATSDMYQTQDGVRAISAEPNH